MDKAEKLAYIEDYYKNQVLNKNPHKNGSGETSENLASILSKYFDKSLLQNKNGYFPFLYYNGVWKLSNKSRTPSGSFPTFDIQLNFEIIPDLLYKVLYVANNISTQKDLHDLLYRRANYLMYEWANSTISLTNFNFKCINIRGEPRENDQYALAMFDAPIDSPEIARIYKKLSESGSNISLYHTTINLNGTEKQMTEIDYSIKELITPNDTTKTRKYYDKVFNEYRFLANKLIMENDCNIDYYLLQNNGDLLDVTKSNPLYFCAKERYPSPTELLAMDKNDHHYKNARTLIQKAHDLQTKFLESSQETTSPLCK